MAKNLFNSLVDYLVVAGCDQDTGLILQNADDNQNFKNQLYTDRFEPHILGVISNSIANYPKNPIRFNIFYPSQSLEENLESPPPTPSIPIPVIQTSPISRRTTRSHSDYLPNITPPTFSHTPLFQKQQSITKGLLNKRVSSKILRPIASFESPIQQDIIQNLVQFCFTEGFVQISKEIIDPSMHSFVLTDIEGRKKFASVLTYYREFYLCENEANDENDDQVIKKYQLVDANNEADETEECKNYVLVYVPTSLVLISKYSYFHVLKECLSSMYESLIEKPENFRKTIENYAFQLTHYPVPPMSSNRFSLILEYSLPFKNIEVCAQNPYGFDIYDMELSFIFNKFSIDNIIKLVLAILTESKILFTSRFNGLLTPVIESFLKLIQPFKWLLPYVPLLPVSLIDYIDAPHPFIMGYNSDYLNTIDQGNGMIIIDIDKNKLSIPEEVQLIEFPSTYINLLKNSLANIDFNYLQTKKLISPLKTNLNKAEHWEKKLIKELNKQISDAFVEFYVNLFGDLRPFIKSKTFNKTNYLESFNEHDLPFYKQIVETSIFELFTIDLIKSLGNERKDLYLERMIEIKLNMNQIPKQCVISDYNQKELDEIIKQRRKSRANSLTLLIPIFKYLKMPKFNEAKTNYSQLCIETFTHEMLTSNLLVQKDCFLILRGLVYITMNKIKEAFKDFHSIEIRELFPKTLIAEEILPLLTNSEKEIIEMQDFYKTSSEFKRSCYKLNKNNSSFARFLHASEILEDDLEYSQFKDLNFIQFCKKLEQLEIRIDIETTKRLFKALTLERFQTLDKDSFDIFIQCYQMKEQELLKISKYLPSNKLRSIEFPIKISNYKVYPSQGIGRIVLTQKSIYFLEQGTNKRTLLVDLHTLYLIEKSVYIKSVFNSKPALKIISENGTYFLCCENEVNLWFLLVNELCSAILLSKELRDDSLIQYAAKNAFLVDTLVTCGLNDQTIHHDDVEKSANYILYYQVLKEDSSKQTSEAKEILNLRLNPSQREQNNQSIESIVFVDIDDYPTVWCAVGNRIKIYDAITWDEEANNLKTNEKITCMFNEEINSKVWIGTIDQSLYVADVITRNFNTKIVLHTDLIVSIAYFELLDIILSGSSNGEIKMWNPKTFEKVNEISLSEASTNRSLTSQLINIICTNSSIVLTSTDQVDILDEKLNKIENSNFQIGNLKEKISCSCISYDKQKDENSLWVGYSRSGIINVWSLKTNELKMRIAVDDCSGFRYFLYVSNFIWAGSKDGKISLFSTINLECKKTFEAHGDTIRSLCYVEKNRFVISGSGSKDGTIGVWRTSNIIKKSALSYMKQMNTVEEEYSFV